MTKKRQHGQALLEFALIVPVFFLILFGLIDGARLVFTDATLSQAAREGSRVGAVEAAWVGRTDAGCVATQSLITSANPGAHVCPVDVAHLKADVVAAVNRMVTGVGPIPAAQIYLSCNDVANGDPAPTGNWTESPGGSSTGTPSTGNGCEDNTNTAIAKVTWIVSVRVTYTYSPITPLISGIWPSFNRTTSATQVIN